MTLQNAEPDLARPDRKTIQSFFNAIPQQYDFLNSFLSFGLVHLWRKRLVCEVLTPHLSASGGSAVGGNPTPTERGEEKGGGRMSILDLGAGTGKSLEAVLKAHPFRYAVGCDFSENMLVKARARLGHSCEMVTGDFHELPFAKEAFDLVTGSFILRSVQNLIAFFSEVNRVLKRGGKAAFLELTRPRSRFVYALYQPYLKFCIPIAGKLVSRHECAYQFLSQSVQSFLEPGAVRQHMEQVGFSELTTKSLTFGTATIIMGTK